jgi:hypothetical protein
MRRCPVVSSVLLPSLATGGGANGTSVPKTGRVARDTPNGEPVNTTHQEAGC